MLQAVVWAVAAAAVCTHCPAGGICSAPDHPASWGIRSSCVMRSLVGGWALTRRSCNTWPLVPFSSHAWGAFIEDMTIECRMHHGPALEALDPKWPPGLHSAKSVP